MCHKYIKKMCIVCTQNCLHACCLRFAWPEHGGDQGNGMQNVKSLAFQVMTMTARSLLHQSRPRDKALAPRRGREGIFWASADPQTLQNIDDGQVEDAEQESITTGSSTRLFSDRQRSLESYSYIDSHLLGCFCKGCIETRS